MALEKGLPTMTGALLNHAESHSRPSSQPVDIHAVTTASLRQSNLLDPPFCKGHSVYIFFFFFSLFPFSLSFFFHVEKGPKDKKRGMYLQFLQVHISSQIPPSLLRPAPMVMMPPTSQTQPPWGKKSRVE
ncbi:hypothetical protein LZ31DRAFT_246580 [Colletotrichum somersetense]|nr:hypothetical protein LZ31DRAFT_246580 [Colletotrichum somersetense]